MKQYTLSLFTVFLITTLSAQIQISGIVVESFKRAQTGDTVTLLGTIILDPADSPDDIKWARDMVFKCDRMLLQVK